MHVATDLLARLLANSRPGGGAEARPHIRRISCRNAILGVHATVTANSPTVSLVGLPFEIPATIGPVDAIFAHHERLAVIRGPACIKRVTKHFQAHRVTRQWSGSPE
jgi:hypothetical protein